MVALIAANLPFINERLFIVGPRRAADKASAGACSSCCCCSARSSALGLALESRIGQRHPQGWEFYAAAVACSSRFAFPGFVWRYLRRGHNG